MTSFQGVQLARRRFDLKQRADCLLRSASCLLPPAFCLLLSAFCLLPSAYGSAWTHQQSGTMAWLRAVYFLNETHGWVAGTNGALLETLDGGNHWKKLLLLTKDTLHDVYFANETTGWLIAERDILKLKTNDEPQSYLLKTEDGGSTWRQISVPDSEANARLVRAVFIDAERGWVFGETGVVFATSDSGAHWTRQSPPTKHLLLGGAFTDYNHGWLAGAGATILQTSDGGATWQSGMIRDGLGARFNAVSFVGNHLGWAVGTGGTIFATTDAGHTWFAQRSSTDVDLLDVKFIDAAEGWAVGNEGFLLHTVDGGAHWTTQSSSTSHALNRVFFTDRNHGWAVGFGGMILTYSPADAPRLKS
jgi:photosystem II stability/assembly factor-like uncharacterized protein